MSPNQLFRQTRWRLAIWYTAIISLILILCGFSVYQALVYAHRVTIIEELESVSVTLHERFKSVLKQPGKWSLAATELFPHACLKEDSCFAVVEQVQRPSKIIESNKYYVRLLNPQGELRAVIQRQPNGLLIAKRSGSWQELTDEDGIRYLQISIRQSTQNSQFWGYLQVGRNLQDFEKYIANLTEVLLMGLPIAILLVVWGSWWLAGKAMQPIYLSYQQIQQFTVDAAHELRTPLAAIRAITESVLIMPTLEEIEVRENLQIVNNQTRRLSNLVEDLLILCRINRQLEKIYNPIILKECVCIKDLVQEIFEALEALALASEIRLISRSLLSESIKVSGDRDQLYRLVYNLVVNALKYNKLGGQVTLIQNRSGNYALIQIKDTGIGISPQELTRIFDRFYRVNNNHSRQTQGSGLGLSIAQAIAYAHNGKIQVKSELGKGSTFTIWLPIKTSY